MAERICSVPGCGAPPRARGWCTKHYQRWRKFGSPLVERVKGRGRQTVVGYIAVHGRLRRDRGPATNQGCIDCGRPAVHWSYTHDCSEEQVDDKYGPYCLHSDHYAPRCRSCHYKFDGIKPSVEVQAMGVQTRRRR